MFPVDDFCRLCFTFEGEFSNMGIDDTKEKATACIPDLEFQDNLPTLICSKCSEQLDMYSEFRNRCLVSQFLLNNFAEKFLGDSITSNNTNNIVTTNTSLGNVKLQRNSNLKSQKELKVFLENIRSFVDASLELNKSSCTVQDFEEFYDKSNPMSCELQDFEDYVSNNVSDCDSDQDDLFIEEEEDENDAQPENLPPIDIEAEHECDNDKPISTKRKIRISEGFNKKSKIDQDFDPGVLIDIAECVKLRKRQVQIPTQAINYSKLSSHNVYKTKNYNKQIAATSESTIPAGNVQANNGSINQLICGTVSDNLGRKLDQISRNEGITTATDFVPDILNNVKKYIKTLQCESHKLEEERIRLLGQKAKFTAILQSLKDNVDTNVCD